MIKIAETTIQELYNYILYLYYMSVGIYLCNSSLKYGFLQVMKRICFICYKLCSGRYISSVTIYVTISKFIHEFR